MQHFCSNLNPKHTVKYTYFYFLVVCFSIKTFKDSVAAIVTMNIF